MLGAEDADDRKWLAAVRADRQVALARSQRLAHLTGVNWFFVSLVAHARAVSLTAEASGAPAAVATAAETSSSRSRSGLSGDPRAEQVPECPRLCVRPGPVGQLGELIEVIRATAACRQSEKKSPRCNLLRLAPASRDRRRHDLNELGVAASGADAPLHLDLDDWRDSWRVSMPQATTSSSGYPSLLCWNATRATGS
jgi:hypothetical protein